jgi:hypothetical protein
MTRVRSAIPLCVLFEQISTQSRSCVAARGKTGVPSLPIVLQAQNVTRKRRRRIYSNAYVNDVLPASTLQPDLTKAWRYDGDCGAARWNGCSGTRDLEILRPAESEDWQEPLPLGGLRCPRLLRVVSGGLGQRHRVLGGLDWLMDIAGAAPIPQANPHGTIGILLADCEWETKFERS